MPDPASATEAQMLADLAHVGITPGDDGVWWVEAEPGPVDCASLREALETLASLRDEDAEQRRGGMSAPCWLIELPGHRWWTGTNGTLTNGSWSWCREESFSADANQAMRFARKQDAERIADLLVVMSGYSYAVRPVATEHSWMHRALGPQPAGTDREGAC